MDQRQVCAVCGRCGLAGVRRCWGWAGGAAVPSETRHVLRAGALLAAERERERETERQRERQRQTEKEREREREKERERERERERILRAGALLRLARSDCPRLRVASVIRIRPPCPPACLLCWTLLHFCTFVAMRCTGLYLFCSSAASIMMMMGFLITVWVHHHIQHIYHPTVLVSIIILPYW
jgi:hypothetical protein